MSSLWNQITKNKKVSSQTYRLFIFLNILCWSVPEFLLVFVIGKIASFPAQEIVTAIMLTAGYAGVFIGLFGGMIFLLRHVDEETHSSQSSVRSSREHVRTGA